MHASALLCVCVCVKLCALFQVSVCTCMYRYEDVCFLPGACLCVCVCEPFTVTDSIHLSPSFHSEKAVAGEKALWTAPLHHQPQLLLTQAPRNLLHGFTPFFNPANRTPEPALRARKKKGSCKTFKVQRTKHLFWQWTRFSQNATIFLAGGSRTATKSKPSTISVKFSTPEIRLAKPSFSSSCLLSID